MPTAPVREVAKPVLLQAQGWLKVTNLDSLILMSKDCSTMRRLRFPKLSHSETRFQKQIVKMKDLRMVTRSVTPTPTNSENRLDFQMVTPTRSAMGCHFQTQRRSRLGWTMD